MSGVRVHIGPATLVVLALLAPAPAVAQENFEIQIYGSAQQHQIFPVVDIDLGPRWELNAGVGVGLTPSTDGLIFKVILGYRFGGEVQEKK